MLVFGKYTEEEYDKILGYIPTERELASRARRQAAEALVQPQRAQASCIRPAYNINDGPLSDYDDSESLTDLIGITPAATFSMCNIHHEDSEDSEDSMSSSFDDCSLDLFDDGICSNINFDD